VSIDIVDLALGVLVGAFAVWVYVLLWKVGYARRGAGGCRAVELGGDRG
jgi:hypothetical protein